MTTAKTKSKVVNMDDKKTEKQAKSKLDFNGFISKVRIDKDKDIPEIYYTERNEKNDKTVILKGQAEPLDSFLKSMQDLSEVICEICEMEEKGGETTITTVNFSEKGGIIISGQIQLENGIPQPLCLNTPHILIKNEKGGYELPDYAKEQVEELKRQAVLYMRGEAKQKQTTLPLDGTNDS